jgi:capsular exopolysaccharide synthesis family protein
MGKVYDALRRAEAQRAQRVGAPPGVAAPVASPHERRMPEQATDRLATLKRWLRIARSPAVIEPTGAVNKRRIVMLHPNSFVAEQFRTLRVRLDSLATERPIRAIAVTSALPGEGKTTAALNLAYVSALGVGRRVLLVDGDLRRPKLHGALGLRPEWGLAEVLTGQAALHQAVMKVDGTTLEVLPVRGMPANPSELLASESMRTLVGELTQTYDQVVFDTPPTLALPDAKILSELVDGVVLVVRAEATPVDDVQAALDLLDRRRILGLVLNGTPTDSRRYGY